VLRAEPGGDERVPDMRRYLYGSLAAHLLFMLLAMIAASVFVRTPPGLRVMRLDLQSLALPEAAPIEPEPEREPKPEPAVEEAPHIPSPPADLAPRRLPLDIEAAPLEAEADPQLDLRAPEALLPREPLPETEFVEAEPEVTAIEDDVDFLEPEDVTAPPVTETNDGGAVQASSTEGVSDFYLARVQQKIGRRWRPSPASVPGRDRAECLVHFRIGPGGEVIGPSIARSSGLSVFDRQAIRAVLASGPLPEVPPRFSRTGLEIRFLFSYER
jgi:TonB family protein